MTRRLPQAIPVAPRTITGTARNYSILGVGTPR